MVFLKYVGVFLGSTLIFGLIIACGDRQSDSNQKQTQARVPTFTPESAGLDAEGEVNRKTVEFLSGLAKWHLKSDPRGLSINERLELEDELMELSDLLDGEDEILRLQIDLYIGAHFANTGHKENLAFRAAYLGANAGLIDLMPEPCTLPDKSEVPQEYYDDFFALEMECLSQELDRALLMQQRVLASETWLKPYIDQILAP